MAKNRKSVVFRKMIIAKYNNLFSFATLKNENYGIKLK